MKSIPITFLDSARATPLSIGISKPAPKTRAARRRSILKQIGLAALLINFASKAVAGIPEPDLVWYGKVINSSNGPQVRITAGTLVWQIEPLIGGPPIVVATALTNINNQFSFVLRVPCETPEPGTISSTNAINLVNPPQRYRRVAVTLDGQPLSVISAPTEITVPFSERGRSERIDLRLGTAMTDSDSDGLADAWELQHFGNLNATANGDPDGDGVNNLREFRAGTDPNNAASRFEVVEISKVPNGVSIRWSSQANRTYCVRRAPSLLAGHASYLPVQSAIAATPPMNEFIDTTAGSSAESFYLIEVEE